MIWANDGLNALSGSGWVGAGLLGLVLGWLLISHIPSLMRAKDEQIKQLMDSWQGRLDKVVEEFARETEKQREAFRSALEALVKHCSGVAVVTRKVE